MSPPQITLDEVRKVARLARLELSDEKARQFVGQLGAILEYVQQISQIDVSGVKPMDHAVPLVNVLRADQAVPGLPLQAVLQNAPAVDGSFFQVPKVIGGDEDSAG